MLATRHQAGVMDMTTVGESAAVPSDLREARCLTGADVGLLILRVVVGIVFLRHGLQKFGLFDSGGYPNSISAQQDMLTFFGYSSVGFLAWTITLSELVAGLSILFGAATQVGAAIIIGIIVQFVLGPQWDAGLFGNASSGGYEFSLVAMAIAVTFAFVVLVVWGVGVGGTPPPPSF